MSSHSIRTILPNKQGNALKFLRVNSQEDSWELAEAGGSFTGDLDDIPEGQTYKRVTQAEKDSYAGKAAGNHNHDATYAPIVHTHDYAATSHNHDGVYSPVGHTHYHFVGTLASNQATGANTTPVSLSGLVFNYEANSKYRIWAMGRVQPTAATTGCGFQFDLSSVVTAINVLHIHQLANTGTLSGGHSIADDASVGVSSGMPGTSTYPVKVEGLLVTEANTGTAQMRFRAEVAAVTTCLAGFTLVVEKI